MAELSQINTWSDTSLYFSVSLGENGERLVTENDHGKLRYIDPDGIQQFSTSVEEETSAGTVVTEREELWYIGADSYSVTNHRVDYSNNSVGSLPVQLSRGDSTRYDPHNNVAFVVEADSTHGVAKVDCSGDISKEWVNGSNIQNVSISPQDEIVVLCQSTGDASIYDYDGTLISSISIGDRVGQAAILNERIFFGVLGFSDGNFVEFTRDGQFVRAMNLPNDGEEPPGMVAKNSVGRIWTLASDTLTEFNSSLEAVGQYTGLYTGYTQRFSGRPYVIDNNTWLPVVADDSAYVMASSSNDKVTVGGQIVNDSGEAVSGATVELVDGEGAVLTETTSASNGTYGIEQKKNTTRTLRVSSPNTFNETTQVTTNLDAVTDVNFILNRNVVSGSVRDYSGTNIDTVDVELVDGGQTVASATPLNGQYEMVGELEKNTEYTLRINSPDGEYFEDEETLNIEDQGVVGFDFVLDKYISISIDVRDANWGLPAINVPIQVVEEDREQARATTSDEGSAEVKAGTRFTEPVRVAVSSGDRRYTTSVVPVDPRGGDTTITVGVTEKTNIGNL